MAHVSRFESISIIVASFVALVWLGEMQRHPFLIFGPAAYILKLTPIWTQMYVAMVGLTLLGMLQAGIDLFRPGCTRSRTPAQIVLQTASLVVLYFLLTADTWSGALRTGQVAAAGYWCSLTQCQSLSPQKPKFVEHFDLARVDHPKELDHGIGEVETSNDRTLPSADLGVLHAS